MSREDESWGVTGDKNRMTEKVFKCITQLLSFQTFFIHTIISYSHYNIEIEIFKYYEILLDLLLLIVQNIEAYEIYHIHVTYVDYITYVTCN